MILLTMSVFLDRNLSILSFLCFLLQTYICYQNEETKEAQNPIHYENTPIQIYRKFNLQKLNIFW